MSEKRPHLSLCMIVRDEAEQLGPCLEEVSGIVDEIVVLDTGSTDDTEEIARRHGARVYQGSWNQDFSRARNEALTHCRGRWILSLDADERLDYLNGHRLLKALRIAEGAEDEEILALAVVVESDVGQAGTGVSARHVFPRVFRNDPHIRWRGALHEQVVHDERQILAHTRLTDVVVRHLGYALPGADERRRDRNADIVARHGEAEPGPFDQLTLAHTAINHGRHQEARQLLLDVLDADLPSNLDATARWSLSSVCLALGKREEARSILDDATGRHPDHHAFVWLLGLIDLEDGRLDEARDRFDDLLSRELPVLVDRTDIMPTRATIEVHRARTLLYAGRVVEALRGLESVLAREPEHPEALFQRAAALEQLGRAGEAVEILNVLHERIPEDPAVSTHRDRCLAVADPPRAPGLSVCLIVRNERDNLAELLPRVRSLADEIVVVDTGSDDDSVAVAEAEGAVVVFHRWRNDFADARNAGLIAAGRRWTLWLDADERLDDGCVDEIRRVVASEELDAVQVTIWSDHGEDDPVARSAGTYCRLFRTDLGARYEGRIHEQILPALERRGARVGSSSIVIRHTGYALDPEAMRAKKLRNLVLLEASAEDRPDDYYLWFQIGSTRVALGDAEEAMTPLRRALEEAPESTPEEIALWLRLRLAQAAFATGELDEAAARARDALDMAPDLDLGHYILAGVWGRRGRPDRALACLRRILRRTDPDPVAPMRRDEVEEAFNRIRDRLEPRGQAA